MTNMMRTHARELTSVAARLWPARPWRNEGGDSGLRLDLLRGFAVIAMVADHIGGGHSWLYVMTGGDRFFVSAAEVFVGISGRVVLAGSWGLWALRQLVPLHAVFPWPIADNGVFHVLARQVLFNTALAIGLHHQHLEERLAHVSPGMVLSLSGVFVGGAIAFYPATQPPASLESVLVVHQVFAKVNLSIGRLIVCAGFLTFAFSLLTVAWAPIDRALRWLLLPLGQHALSAYTWRLFVTDLIMRMKPAIVGAAPATAAQNTLLQVVGIALIWAIIRLQPTALTQCRASVSRVKNLLAVKREYLSLPAHSSHRYPDTRPRETAGWSEPFWCGRPAAGTGCDSRASVTQTIACMDSVATSPPTRRMFSYGNGSFSRSLSADTNRHASCASDVITRSMTIGITRGDASHRPNAFVGLEKEGEATELIEELRLQGLKRLHFNRPAVIVVQRNEAVIFFHRSRPPQGVERWTHGSIR
jgi:hypothetical protein